LDLKEERNMRKLIGFICFIVSLVWIVVTIIVSIEPIINLFDQIFNGGNILQLLATFLGTYGTILSGPIMILLLSVIAMGTYDEKGR
jgi:hypothetical protein